MKEYTRDALGALGNFYERVALVYDPDFSTKDINEVIDESCRSYLADIAYDMMVGELPRDFNQSESFENEYGSAHCYEYEQLRSYAEAFGIPSCTKESIKRFCDGGGPHTDSVVENLLELVVDALIDGLYDTWEYFASI